MEHTGRKRFHRSDTLRYEYSTVETPVDLKQMSFVRQHIDLAASLGVTWQDIVEEFYFLNGRLDLQNSILTTCITENEDCLVALTYRGFQKAAENQLGYGKMSYKELITLLSKNLVALRDYNEYIKNNNMEMSEKSYFDFYPKD